MVLISIILDLMMMEEHIIITHSSILQDSNISYQNTPGGYNNGVDDHFDSVGAQDANENDKKIFLLDKVYLSK